MEPVEREFLTKALAFYERLAGETGKDPRVRFETAQAYVRVAEIQHNLGEVEQAEKGHGGGTCARARCPPRPSTPALP